MVTIESNKCIGHIKAFRFIPQNRVAGDDGIGVGDPHVIPSREYGFPDCDGTEIPCENSRTAFENPVDLKPLEHGGDVAGRYTGSMPAAMAWVMAQQNRVHRPNLMTHLLEGIHSSRVAHMAARDMRMNC